MICMRILEVTEFKESFNVFLFVSIEGSDDSTLIQHIYCGTQDDTNDMLEIFTFGGGPYMYMYVNFQMANLPCFLIVGVRYL